MLGSKRLELPAGGPAGNGVHAHLPRPGSYAIEAALVNHQDLLPADDHRALLPPG